MVAVNARKIQKKKSEQDGGKEREEAHSLIIFTKSQLGCYIMTTT
jgi:hypothetical protein